MDSSIKVNGETRKATILNILDCNSSSGNLRKWIISIEGLTGIFYVKSSSRRRSFIGFECESECIAFRLASMLGIESIKYEMGEFTVDNKKYKVCISKNYASEYSTLSIAKALPKVSHLYGYEKYNEVVRFIGMNCKDALDKMLMLDYIIGNPDRHLNNIEFFIQDNKILRLVPVFDCGAGLFSSESITGIKLIWNSCVAYGNCKPFFNTFKQQKELTNTTTLNKVKLVNVYRLVNFYLKGDRAKIVNKWLKYRLGKLGLLC